MSISRKTYVLAASTAAAGLIMLPTFHRSKLRLVWNVSASIPIGLYRIEPGSTLRTGELAAMRPSAELARFMDRRHYVEAGAVLLKPVAATGGATICRHKLLVSIDGSRHAVALRADRFGRPLPSWSGCRRLRHDELFLLAGAKQDSFDGRYFGPVKRSAIVGRATPIWAGG